MRGVFAAIVSVVLLAHCLSTSGQETARTLRLNEETYDAIRTALICSKQESSWREIPWRPNLGEAIIEARKKKKPILLWMMNGHPCGMT